VGDRVVLAAMKAWAAQGAQGESARTPGPLGGLGAVSRDPVKGYLGEVVASALVAAPSYVAYDRARSAVFVAQDFSTVGPGEAGYGHPGSLSALRLGRGSFELLNSVASGGRIPCHVSVHQDRRHLFVSDYEDGTVSVRRIGSDGRLSEETSSFRDPGSGPVPGRQDGSHAHMVYPVPGTKWDLMVDLGSDEVKVLSLQCDEGTVMVRSRVRLTPGSGPRHVVHHPDNFVLVANELSSTVAVLHLDAGRGVLRMVGEVSSCSDDVGTGNAPSGIVLSADGRTVFVGNRGRDTISVFSVLGEDLKLSDEADAGGEPRALVMIGEQLYVSNMASDNINVFRPQLERGILGPPIQTWGCPKPTCLVGAG
jgi:6-phosphogluconolactonase